MDLTKLSSTPKGVSFSFRLPPGTQMPVYLRMRNIARIPRGYSLFIDDLAVSEGTELYTGGPYVCAFTGLRSGIAGDTWQIDVANDRRGRLQEYFERLFDMSGKGLMLPVAGQNPIPDSVIVGNQTSEV